MWRQVEVPQQRRYKHVFRMPTEGVYSYSQSYFGSTVGTLNVASHCTREMNMVGQRKMTAALSSLSVGNPEGQI
jgi:transcription elongation GreA/GreB family factor